MMAKEIEGGEHEPERVGEREGHDEPHALKTKTEAEYTSHGTGKAHCGICEHVERPHSCEVVKGKISLGGWCHYFAIAPRHALAHAMHSGKTERMGDYERE